MKRMLFCSIAFLMLQVHAATPAGYQLSGPHTHRNLTIFLIHGKDRISTSHFLTLQEALDQKKVAVHETGSVNELSVENLSNDRDVYIQAGEIVKGGRQDRVLGLDLILRPHSGRVAISAFCVEHGRWTQRQQESASSFASSNDQIVSKDLKRAVKEAKEQQTVWDKVSEMQSKLEANLGAPVRSQVSDSSLQLTLEDQNVRQSLEEYLKVLQEIVHGKNDVVGYVFAINGKMNSADVYASASLFQKLWPKLLRSAATEAVAELRKDKPMQPASAVTLETAMIDAESGKITEKEERGPMSFVTRETDRNLLFETLYNGTWVHRNIITKD